MGNSHRTGGVLWGMVTVAPAGVQKTLYTDRAFNQAYIIQKAMDVLCWPPNLTCAFNLPLYRFVTTYEYNMLLDYHLVPKLKYMAKLSALWFWRCKKSNSVCKHFYVFVFQSFVRKHYNDVIMSAMASQITGLSIVCSTVYSVADQRKHQSSASLAFVMGIQLRPVNFPLKGPVTRKMFQFDDVIMQPWVCTSK